MVQKYEYSIRRYSAQQKQQQLQLLQEILKFLWLNYCRSMQIAISGHMVIRVCVCV